MLVWGRNKAWAGVQSGVQRACGGGPNVPMPRQTDAERAKGKTQGDAVGECGEERSFSSAVLQDSVQLDSRQAAAKGLTETGEPRTPRSAVRPRMASFSQTACPYNVSALSTPLAASLRSASAELLLLLLLPLLLLLLLLLGGTARGGSNGGTSTAGS